MKIEPFKMKVTPSQSRVVQETLVEKGGTHPQGETHPMCTESPYLYLGKDSRILVGSTEAFYQSHYLPELTFEQFQELYCEWVLPEKWCVKSTPETFEVIQNGFNLLIGRFPLDPGKRAYYHFPLFGGLCTTSYHKDLSYTEITFEQFKKYVLKQDMKEEKEIIGYIWKSGFDKYEAAAVEICKKNCNVAKDFNLKPLSSGVCFDRESKIVDYFKEAGVFDIWFEPVYENYVPKITVNGHAAEFFDTYVKFGCAEINKQVFIDLHTIQEYPHTNRCVESVTIGMGVFSKGEIKEIAEYFLNKGVQEEEEAIPYSYKKPCKKVKNE